MATVLVASASQIVAVQWAFASLMALGFILMQGGFSIRNQPSSVGDHESPSCEQPVHGHIHFPLQLKYLL